MWYSTKMRLWFGHIMFAHIQAICEEDLMGTSAVINKTICQHTLPIGTHYIIPFIPHANPCVCTHCFPDY